MQGSATIPEEVDLGDQKKEFKGKTIKIKKLVKKENGSFTLKDTYIQEGGDSLNNDSLNRGNQGLDPNSQKELQQILPGLASGGNPNSQYETSHSTQPEFNFSKQQGPPKEVRPSYHSVVSQTLTQYEQNQGRFGHPNAQDHHASNNLASPRNSERRATGTIQESYVIQSSSNPNQVDMQEADIRKSTTDYVDVQDETKEVTKITITSKSTKPITEYVERRQRPQRSMFLSGHVQPPAGGRFANFQMAESQEITPPNQNLGRGEAASQQGQSGSSYQSGMAASIALPSYARDNNPGMSTSQYMGNVVTNRLLAGRGVAAAGAAIANAAKNGDRTRSTSVMYHSQASNSNPSAPRLSAVQGISKQDARFFTVPPKVQQFLDNSMNEFKYLEKDVLTERAKMNSELDNLLKAFTQIVENKRAALNSTFDGYLESFKENLDSTKQKTASFKDSTEWSKLRNSPNGDRLVRLTDIAYYSKESNSTLYQLYKKDPHKSICELRNLKQEVSKHNLEFYVAEMEKMSIHPPQFANTSSSAEFLSELKQRAFKAVQTAVDDFAELTSKSPFLLFKHSFSEPHIATALGESRLNCLTNMRGLSAQSIIASRVHNLSHSADITTILNVDDESFATGDADGTIGVFNHVLGQETHKFKMKGISPVTALGRIRTSNILLAGGDQMVASAHHDPTVDKHDQNIFLISGHAKPDCVASHPIVREELECVLSIWDLKKQVFVKHLSGHTDDVTAISSLQDGHTLFTGSRSGTVIVFNITKQKPLRIIQHLVNSPVNCIYTFNDLSRVGVGYDNGELSIWSLVYEINAVDKLAQCVACSLATTLKCKSAVLSVNESHQNPETVVTGHEDGKLRIWDTNSQTVVKQLDQHTSPILSTLVVENPFAVDLDSNYFIISCGDTQEEPFLLTLPQLLHSLCLLSHSQNWFWGCLIPLLPFYGPTQTRYIHSASAI